MILAHPRSKSNLMADCFKNYYGEIFNITILNKDTFEIQQSTRPDPTPISILWKQEWVHNYLEYLKEKLTADPNAVFKVFYHQIMFSPEARDLIQTLRPKIFYIYRKNELAAIKSYLLALKRGFSMNESTILTESFTVSPLQFLESYHYCVVLPKLARNLYKIDWSSTYEEFSYDNFPYAEQVPKIKPQNSSKEFSFIENEAEIDKWFNDVSQKY